MATYIVPDDYSTINSAVAAASYLSADTIRVRVGTYAEDIDLRASTGGWLKPVTIEAYDPNNKPTITGAGAAQTIRGDSLYNGGTVGTATLRNLIFSGCLGASNGIVYFNSSASVIENCTFTGNDGVRCIRWVFGSSTRYGYVTGCTFLNTTTGEAVRIGGGSTDYVRVYNNVIVRSAPAAGAIVAVSTSDGLVYNNSIYFGTISGSWTAISAKTATNNAIVANSGTINKGIDAGTYTTNDAYGSYTTRYSGVNGGGNLTTDPQYTSGATGNLLPVTGSPLIGAGTNLTASGVSGSQNGVARPASGAWTIGAYEVPVTTTVASITVLGPTSLRLNLAGTVSSDSTWTTAGNYTITPSGGAAAVTVSSAAISTATTITLTTSEHTNGGAYNLAWAGLTNITNGNSNYTGQGTAPTVTAASMTAGKTIRVTFSEAMTNNAALTTAGNYTVTGATVSSVARVDATRVDVTIAQRIPAASSSITVNGPQDLALNPVSNSSQSFAVPYLTMVSGTSPSRTSAAITFNIAPTGGVSAASNWTVTPATTGASVAVTGVVATSSTVYTLTVWPPMTPAVGYVVAAPNAAAATGPIG